jgi:hypothetical protein
VLLVNASKSRKCDRHLGIWKLLHFFTASPRVIWRFRTCLRSTYPETERGQNQIRRDGELMTNATPAVAQRDRECRDSRPSRFFNEKDFETIVPNIAPFAGKS